jgi:hypothetical protein
MAYFSNICVCVVLFVTVVLGDSANGCTSFSANGSAESYFEYYRFYDFRNIQTSTTAQSTASDASLFSTSQTINNASWTDDWSIRVQSKGAANDNALPMQYSSSNVNIRTLPSLNLTSYIDKLIPVSRKQYRFLTRLHHLPDPLHNPATILPTGR